MISVIEIFKEITAIPRCSGTYEPFINYIKDFASKNDYDCYVDNYHNILCKKSNSKAKLAIQNHYDIVCLKENCVPTIIEEDGFLKAKESTLGADNGIGCSYMLWLMTQGYDCEFLFTSDEEIGLIGANNLEHQLNADYMLNIDSEQEGEICIGCAGGVDIFGKSSFKSIIENEENYKLYEVEISNLPGGHSGVDIHKNVPNGIKLIGELIVENNALLLDINGGERINSIPVNVKAIIACKHKPKEIPHDNIRIRKITTKSEHLNVWDRNIATFIYTFANGVRAYDEKLGVVLNSINLAKITTKIDAIEVELSARSMDNDELKKLKKETTVLLKSFGFDVTTNGKYSAWRPDINEFTNRVLDIYKKYDEDASLEAIHAGLECAIFKKKFPHMKLASIGPNIFNPHSNREKVEIASIEKLSKIVKEIVDSF
ncbi:aminoacyl-histidine dipeptidase [Halarcobacter ebronensis]|uniref:Aminoacyl-histidine dipeptidase n=1 Tax=Halarcobacter ebronensis TaxID=1462615 RepID=A0A4Q0YI32_9BACT|nr:M20/M25/M40 family metallo-hydrolase [Halarcobacter ebronensis]RXJ70352.1 aminoacyl-histidine dipeptidase [Halarcobacter ebronensis]